MRRAIVCLGLALGSILAAASPGNAQVPPPISNRPAATLLLPYFEVDLDNGQGINTIFSVNNASATAVLAHVTIWSDMGVPVLNFDVYLTGFDTQRIDLRSVLLGDLPTTASVGQDPPTRSVRRAPCRRTSISRRVPARFRMRRCRRESVAHVARRAHRQSVARAWRAVRRRAITARRASRAATSPSTR